MDRSRHGEHTDTPPRPHPAYREACTKGAEVTEFSSYDQPETEDPRLDLVFNVKDSEEQITVSVTVSSDGDVRRVWDELGDLSQGAALHELARSLFQDLTRDVK